MEVIVEYCAGLDVHKDTVVACVRVPGRDGEVVKHYAEFATFTEDLLALRDWLVAWGVSRVGMEATGVYWKPVFYVLEDATECWLLNARHMHNVPGRKTDMSDADWICRLMRHGLVRSSFVPPPPIRELRNLTRYRRTRMEERTRETQRLDKILQDAGIKLSSVASDVLGVSGRAMLDALISGTHNPEVLAELARGRLRSKIGLLQSALTGRFGPNHAIVVGEILAHLDYIDESLQRLQAAIEDVSAPFAQARARLMTIPGVDKITAEALIAEIGVDMSAFPTAAHLASWAGMCPGQHESAGKSRHGTARPGNTWLRRTLTVAAMGAARTTNSHLASEYQRIAARRGKRRARKAVGHSIIVGAWHILHNNTDWNDLGVDYYDRRRDPTRTAQRKIADLRSLGWTVSTNPDGTTTLTPPLAA
ncbi:MAG: IS110 family transposase [Ilumatobacteraceae bacterium]